MIFLIILGYLKRDYLKAKWIEFMEQISSYQGNKSNPESGLLLLDGSHPK